MFWFGSDLLSVAHFVNLSCVTYYFHFVELFSFRASTFRSEVGKFDLKCFIKSYESVLHFIFLICMCHHKPIHDCMMTNEITSNEIT